MKKKTIHTEWNKLKAGDDFFLAQVVESHSKRPVKCSSLIKVSVVLGSQEITF